MFNSNRADRLSWGTSIQCCEGSTRWASLSARWQQGVWFLQDTNYLMVACGMNGGTRGGDF